MPSVRPRPVSFPVIRYIHGYDQSTVSVSGKFCDSIFVQFVVEIDLCSRIQVCHTWKSLFTTLETRRVLSDLDDLYSCFFGIDSEK